MTSKFNSYDKNSKEISHDYGDIFEHEPTKGSSRLKIGVTRNAIDMMIKLADSLTPPFFVLYVLVTTRRGNELGRYQSPLIETKEELDSFFRHFRDYFETDGRHHVWIGTVDNSGTIIYDQHNVIFAYGPTDKWKEELMNNGYREKSFELPAPHSHEFHSDNDKYEDEIMNYWDWSIFKLEEQDLYD
jgi:hypothetical protein